MYVSDLIEYIYTFLKICYDSVIVSAGFNDVYPIVFYCDFFNWYIFQDLLNCCWFFSSNAKYTYIGHVSCGKSTVTGDIVCWLGYIWHVVMFAVLGNDTNGSTSWWEINSDFKYIIFDKGVIWEINL